MEYYRTLHLEREPFSNSPDPDLFYHSRQHLEALQQLEIAIRLKRGLNIVTGDVGTGKTTLSRQLIRQIGEDPNISHALVLDPVFETPSEFLSCILTSLRGDAASATDEAGLREEMKGCLFQKGVDEKAVLVLLIDEGQKLPLFCLEILRELLNYETNDQKLLQIVIFAQKEFDRMILPLNYFVDRINFRYRLNPLGYRETKALIRFRLQRSILPGQAVPFFTFWGYLALYQYTRGYPRKIIHLCHHILLALIIQTRSRAGYFFVRSCALKLAQESPIWRRIAIFPSLAVLLCLIWAYGVGLPDLTRFFSGLSGHQTPVSRASSQLMQPKPVLNTTLTDPGATVSEDAKPDPDGTADRAGPKEPPLFYGSFTVSRNLTLSEMLEFVYGSSQKKFQRLVLSHNRDVRNPNLLKAGMSLNFPVLSEAETRNWNPSSFCIVLDRYSTLNDAYAGAGQYHGRDYDVRLVPGRNKANGFVFYLVVQKEFPDLTRAEIFCNTHAELNPAVCRKVSSIMANTTAL